MFRSPHTISGKEQQRQPIPIACTIDRQYSIPVLSQSIEIVMIGHNDDDKSEIQIPLDTPMRLALEDHDILEEVFQQLLPTGIDTENLPEFRIARNALAQAARTCKAFNLPATNVLWRFMDSLVPLFMILQSSGRYGDDYVRGTYF